MGYTEAMSIINLFCFPHAGGGVGTFRYWQRETPGFINVIPVVMPNRRPGVRINGFDGMIEHLFDDIQEKVSRGPFAFFGHSLGALICFELASLLAAKRFETPRCLFLSAMRAPHVPPRRQNLSTATNEELGAFFNGIFPNDDIDDEVKE
ncbi:MAG: hypothetical protein GF344_02900, partial [Chitinivibrionales bacterium]|nr:hypothetical protein [Chitinivibrionales bacterium]